MTIQRPAISARTERSRRSAQLLRCWGAGLATLLAVMVLAGCESGLIEPDAQVSEQSQSLGSIRVDVDLNTGAVQTSFVSATSASSLNSGVAKQNQPPPSLEGWLEEGAATCSNCGNGNYNQWKVILVPLKNKGNFTLYGLDTVGTQCDNANTCAGVLPTSRLLPRCSTTLEVSVWPKVGHPKFAVSIDVTGHLRPPHSDEPACS